jgi:hypothetical protein
MNHRGRSTSWFAKGAPVACATLLLVGCAAFKTLPAYEQTYLAALHNGAFRTQFPRADHITNGFDYGHAILYETLIARARPTERLEGPTFARLTTQVLRHPPSVPLKDAAIGPRYVALVPEVAAMFEWAHMLHRQLYDIWSIPGWSGVLRDAEVARAIRYYQTRPDLALSSVPKDMSLMEGQPYSKVFRAQAPKFNGLLWSYHWMQMALYDALLVDTDPLAQRKAVDLVVDRFFALIADAPREMPSMMPMSAAVAPVFSTRHPEAAIIFDNLHALHDVVSDLLLSDVVPTNRKREIILRAAAAYRDDSTSITTRSEWLEMSQMMTEPRLRPPPSR